MFRSPKTTLAGIGAILTALGAGVSQYAEAGANGIDWATLIPAIVIGVGLITARDNSVSSEKAGAK